MDTQTPPICAWHKKVYPHISLLDVKIRLWYLLPFRQKRNQMLIWGNGASQIHGLCFIQASQVLPYQTSLFYWISFIHRITVILEQKRPLKFTWIKEPNMLKRRVFTFFWPISVNTDIQYWWLFVLPTVQCSPVQPWWHSHLPSLQVPCSVQRGWHAFRSHTEPAQPSSQRQLPPKHTPWEPQSTAHTSANTNKAKKLKSLFVLGCSLAKDDNGHVFYKVVAHFKFKSPLLKTARAEVTFLRTVKSKLLTSSVKNLWQEIDNFRPLLCLAGCVAGGLPAPPQSAPRNNDISQPSLT